MNELKNKILKWRFPLFCLMTGGILRILYLHAFADLPLCQFPCGPDIGEYVADMCAILSGNLPQEMIHAPLYGCLMALLHLLCSGSFFWMRLLQSLLIMSAGIPLFLILQRNCKRHSIIPGTFLFLFCIYPPFILWQCDFYSENLMLFCCCWALFLLDRSTLPGTQHKKTVLFSAGLLCGCSIISHPMAAFFAAGTVLYFLIRYKWKKQTLQKIVLFSVGVILLLAPVSISRSIRAGKPVLIQQNSGFNIFLGNHPEATGTCRIPPGDEWNRIHEQANKSPEGSDRYFLSRTKEFILSHPIQWGKLLLKKAALTFSAQELTTWSDVTILRQIFLHKLFYYSFPLIGICAAATLILLMNDRKNRIRFQLFLLLFFSFFPAQILLLTSGRYRIMCVVAMLVFTAILPELFRIKWKSDTPVQKRIFQFAIPLFIGALLVFLPLHQPDLEKEKSMANMILAESWNLAGEKTKAEQILLKIPAEIRNNNAAILNLLGTIQLESGKLPEAEKNLLAAHKCYPEYPNPLLNLGKLYETKNPALAAKCYHAALPHATPATKELLFFNLGVLYQKSGNLNEAERYYREIIKQYPASLRPYRNLAILLLNKNDLKGAEQLLRHAWKCDKENPGRTIDLAYLLLTAGRKQEAETLLRDLLKSHPGNQDAVQLLSELNKQQ